MSYIDVEKALESINLIAEKDGKSFDKDSARYAIQTTEPTDVVEVVRCKDCVFCKYNEDADVHKCDRRGYFTEYVNPDKDYCSHGKT